MLLIASLFFQRNYENIFEEVHGGIFIFLFFFFIELLSNKASEQIVYDGLDLYTLQGFMNFISKKKIDACCTFNVTYIQNTAAVKI